MKKLIYGVSFLALVGILLVACNKEGIMNPQSNSQKLEFESFEKYGQIHNDFLTNAKKSFKGLKNIENGSKAISHVREFNIEYANSLDLPLSSKESLKKGLLDFEDFVVKEKLVKHLYPSTEKSGNSSVFELIDQLNISNQISNFDENCLENLLAGFRDSYEGKLSQDDIHNLLIGMEREMDC